MAKIAITGMGALSAIGDNLKDTWESISHAQSGLKELSSLDSIHQGKLYLGAVPFDHSELRKKYNISNDTILTRAGLLAIGAISEVVDSFGFSNDEISSAALISSTSVGGIDIKEQYFHQYPFYDDRDRYIVSNHPGYTTRTIVQHFGIRGLVSTISTACSSAANAIMMGAQLILSGRADRVIAGGTDALTKFTVNGFNTLMILTDEVNKPFDKDRKGLNLGEGAAYIMLESEMSLGKSGRQVLAYLTGYANANDAHHQTASSDDGQGAYLAMKQAIDLAEIDPSQISYINVHGTATENNDITEGRALKRIFGDSIPPFSSTKPFTGHALAAAGGLEAVFSILSIQHQAIPPSLNFEHPIPELNMLPETQYKEMPLNHVLSNSFGFGGNCSSLIFSKS